MQANATPGKKVKSIFATFKGQAEVKLDAERYKELAEAEGMPHYILL